MGARAILTSMFLALGLPAGAGSVVPFAEPEFGPETLSLVVATEALFDAIEAESGTFDKRSPGLTLRPTAARAEPVSFEIPRVGRNALRPDIGAVANLTGYQITWYPTETLSGTVDFVGTWNGGKNLVCGYLSWDMSNPAVPTLAAMTTSYLDTGALLGLSPDAAHAELLRANCAYGEIEPNLELVRR